MKAGRDTCLPHLKAGKKVEVNTHSKEIHMYMNRSIAKNLGELILLMSVVGRLRLVSAIGTGGIDWFSYHQNNG